MESNIEEALADGELKVYKRRWWILFLFASLGFMQCSVWNTWGPITISVEEAYPSWKDSDIGLLSMWGTVTAMIGIVPFTAFLQRYGMRKSILLTSFLMALGTTVRIFTTKEKPFTVLVHLGAILNGFAGIIICSAPSLLSSLWFPLHQRTTATGIGCTFNQLGNAGGFFLGPTVVKPPMENVLNHNVTDAERELIRKSINDYLWIVAGICVGIFILVLAYFPDKPDRPPSLSSACKHQTTSSSISGDIWKLCRNSNFWCLLIPYSLTLGINVAWSSVIDINVSAKQISQTDASWMGVYVTFGGVILAVISAKFTDFLFGHMKVTIITLLSISTLGFIWFLLLMDDYIPSNKTHLFISIIIGSSFGYACSPLFFEFAVEICHPISEGLVGGFLAFGWNFVSLLFLLILEKPMKNYIWMDYILAIQGVCSILVMFLVKEEYRRSAPVEDSDPPLLGQEEEGDLTHCDSDSAIVV